MNLMAYTDQSATQLENKPVENGETDRIQSIGSRKSTDDHMKLDRANAVEL